MSDRPRPVTLCVLDGFGLSDDPRGNPLLSARLPTWDALLAEWPSCRLEASGEAVGLPAGQMGNSEVGHLNLGAGFRVLQDLPRISAAIADGSFFANPALGAAVEAAATRGSRLHLIGLIGPGGIHAVDEHIEAMVELATRGGLPAERVLLHAITDGRDTPPRSARALLPSLIGRLPGATLATVGGRYYAMDRDRRWERTALAWEAIVHGRGEAAPDGAAALSAADSRGESDEFVRPTVIGAYHGIRDDDVVVVLNFRADRARQLTQALALDAFIGFDRGRRPAGLHLVTLTEYEDPARLPVEVAFPPQVTGSLASYLSERGLRQLHLAETEKYAHVTYFFNGGREEPLPGEERVLVPSRRDVPTYDLAPEMSAWPITERLEAETARGSWDFIVVNYANADMVGHTGVWEAGIAAAEVLDACLARIVAASRAADRALVITADHGNIESMRDAAGEPKTAHTSAPVPLVLVAEAVRGRALRDGALSDVAPTICELMGLPPGPAMTGTSLLRPSS